MTRETAEQCIAALAQTDIPTVDITGGAPELNPNFRWLVEQARAMNRHVMDRCNLSVLLLPSQADLATFLAAHRVEIVASLPYYRAAQTDAQRGEGIFDKSMEALRLLNQLGYGREGSGLLLNLVQNPVGAFLPPKQESIEAQFRKELRTKHGVEFNRLGARVLAAPPRFAIGGESAGAHLAVLTLIRLRDDGDLGARSSPRTSSTAPTTCR